jgi:holliday junction DNA helicase RuvA
MIARLTGTVVLNAGTSAVLDVQGVGYEVSCTPGVSSTLTVGEEVALEILTDVKEDSIKLYGFSTLLEKRVAQLLMKVKGIGARSASEILSHVGAESLLKMLGDGDVATLQGIKGIGKKTAARLVVELSEAVNTFTSEVSLSSRIIKENSATGENQKYSDAVAALCALGFPASSAEKAVGRVRDGHMKLGDSGDVVREALRLI